MNLPSSFRNELIASLDDYLENFKSNPDDEAISGFVQEELEVWADDEGYDDIIGDLEDSGSLDAPFAEALEEEIASDSDAVYTGEHIVTVLTRLCDVEWDDDDDDDLDDDSEEEDLDDSEEY